MKVSQINTQGLNSRPSDYQLRLDSIRQSLRKNGAAIVNVNDTNDMKAVEALKNQFGAANVNLTQSSNAKLTVNNFNK